MEIKNPRYPHWCRIIRKTVADPMVDEEDFSPYDRENGSGASGSSSVDALLSGDLYDYDPMGGDMDDPIADDSIADDSIADDSGSSQDSGDSSDSSDEGAQTVVIYEGECRSYKVNTTSDKGEIISSQRGLALPLNQDGWDELGTIPMEGDEIVVVHGTTFKEYGRVIDKNVATASFAGTHLIWRYGRN